MIERALKTGEIDCSPVERSVLLFAASHCPRIILSYDYISAVTGYSRGAVYGALQFWRKDGLLVLLERGGGDDDNANHYAIDFEKSSWRELFRRPEIVHGLNSLKRQRVQTPPAKSSNGAPNSSNNALKSSPGEPKELLKPKGDPTPKENRQTKSETTSPNTLPRQDAMGAAVFSSSSSEEKQNQEREGRFIFVHAIGDPNRRLFQTPLPLTVESVRSFIEAFKKIYHRQPEIPGNTPFLFKSRKHGSVIGDYATFIRAHGSQEEAASVSVFQRSEAFNNEIRKLAAKKTLS